MRGLRKLKRVIKIQIRCLLSTCSALRGTVCHIAPTLWSPSKQKPPQSQDAALVIFIFPAPGPLPGTKQPFNNVPVKSCIRNFHSVYLISWSQLPCRVDMPLINKCLWSKTIYWHKQYIDHQASTRDTAVNKILPALLFYRWNWGVQWWLSWNHTACEL